MSECADLDDCVAKCNACDACCAVKYIAGGGGDIRCHMMTDQSIQNTGIVATNPDPSTWQYWVNERAAVCAEARRHAWKQLTNLFLGLGEDVFSDYVIC